MNEPHSSRAPRITRPLSLSTEPPRGARSFTLITCDDFVAYYIAEGDRLQRCGIEPQASAAHYHAAYPLLCQFVRRHGELLSERGVVSAELDAGPVLLARLSEGTVGTPAETPPLESAILMRAAHRLTQSRESVRRVLRGRPAELADFGLTHQVDPRSPGSVQKNIERFLGGARRHPDLLRTCRVLAADLDELGSYLPALVSLAGLLPEPPTGPMCALLAVDAYFAGLAAAISSAFPPGDPRRTTGLRLIPRGADKDRRARFGRARLWREALPSIDD